MRRARLGFALVLGLLAAAAVAAQASTTERRAALMDALAGAVPAWCL
jgi:hypothetical protein